MKKVLYLCLILILMMNNSVFAQDVLSYEITDLNIDKTLEMEKQDFTNSNNESLKLLRDNRDVQVIMYHKLSNNPAEWSQWCTSPKNFEEDIVYLKNKGYTFLKVNELMDLRCSHLKKVAIITFDDGYMSDYEMALPILEKHNVKATFFVIGAMVGKNEYMDEKAIIKLSNSPLVEIGNHSYDLHLKTYKEIEMLFSLNSNYVYNDFMKNKSYLESIIGKKVTSLSYPNGIYTKSTDYLLKRNGTKITFSTGIEKVEKSMFNAIGRKNRAHNLTMDYYVK
ncbi:MAG: polysaccharide deacetylase family protein [Ruminococcaceae bacterium]|nr:polysaccharide deacetylase family protein [Oscillospiraceae bacterium]